MASKTNELDLSVIEKNRNQAVKNLDELDGQLQKKVAKNPGIDIQKTQGTMKV